MRKLSIYRLLAAYGLLLVLALPLGIQGLHPYVDEHEPQTHCDSDRGQNHLHDESYAFDHCFVCTFHFSHYTDQPESFSFHNPGWMLQDLLIEGDQFLDNTAFFSRSSRAPPATA